jgi:pimeloyl-ACP methyl ester carboxylesterase
MDRSDLTFESGGERCAAWLYTPDAPPPHPIVVLAHGFGGVRTARLGAFAERFAAAGMAALVFDYRHFGDSSGEPRQLLDIGRQLDDWRSAIEFARALDGVDGERVAIWGSSFSGGHVAVIAAEDHRVAAAVSQGPFLDGLWALRAAGPANIVRLTVHGLRDEARRLRGRAPHYIAIVGPPGSVAAMNSPDAEPGYRALFSGGDEFRNEVAGRIGLKVGLYRPIRYAGRIACPWLLCVCDRDVVTPPEPALKAAKRAPRSEVRRYDVEHFDIYVGETFERVVADEVAFLERHLLADVPAQRATAG